MEENIKKRSYTVPVLLVLIFIVMVLLVMSYSKLLLLQQSEMTDKGEALAKSYSHAVRMADNLSQAMEELRSGEPDKQLQAMKRLGEASVAAEAAAPLFVEARLLSSAGKRSELMEEIDREREVLFDEGGKLGGLGMHQGELTETELAVADAVQEASAQLTAKLATFRPPSGEAGYRQMSAGGAWVAVAAEASEIVAELGEQMK